MGGFAQNLRHVHGADNRWWEFVYAPRAHQAFLDRRASRRLRRLSHADDDFDGIPILASSTEAKMIPRNVYRGSGVEPSSDARILFSEIAFK